MTSTFVRSFVHKVLPGFGIDFIWNDVPFFSDLSFRQTEYFAVMEIFVTSSKKKKIPSSDKMFCCAVCQA